MAKNSVTEWDDVAGNNLDIEGISLSENMPPSYVNNAIREMMAQIKQWKDGYTDPTSGLPVYQSTTVENIEVEGDADFKGNLTLDGNYGTSGQVIVSNGNDLPPTWGSGFPTGGIVLWSSNVGSIPGGWALCDGDNGTPDLRNRFVVGAGPAYAVDDTGGSTTATLPTHSHTATSSVIDPGHTHTAANQKGPAYGQASGAITLNPGSTGSAKTNISVSTSISSAGTSAVNANLPPYYALAYIMKL